ncbi:MAG TPA: hypothetical protein VMT73_12470 [Anaerolineales bacterium]|nr:hypothetical protein [Anaerolineales bacterium]
MKKQGLLRLFAFVALIIMVGLACNGGTTPTPAPVQPQPTQVQQQQQQSQPTEVPQQTSNSSGSLQTFTDQNKLYAIDLPGDWTYKQTTDQTNNYYYIDTFTSPDKNALVENIVYNDGKSFSGAQNGKFALGILNQFYSETGKEGDIHVTDDSIQKDGSERLTWYSQGGGYSGISFFEIRGSDRKTFLMFTVEWSNSAKDQYLDTLDSVIQSYRQP